MHLQAAYTQKTHPDNPNNLDCLTISVPQEVGFELDS